MDNTLRRYVRSGIASVLVLSTVAFIGTGLNIPQWYETVVTLVVGFYFGEQSARSQ